jgi:hypothetical protein
MHYALKKALPIMVGLFNMENNFREPEIFHAENASGASAD